MSAEQRLYDRHHRFAAISYVWWLFKANLFALIGVSPLIAAALLLDGSVMSTTLLFIAGLTVGPAVYVVIAQLLDLDRYEGVRFRNCIRAYRQQFWRVQLLWAPGWLLLFFAATNLYLGVGGAPGRWISVAIVAVAATFLVNTLVLMARWPQAPAATALAVTAKLSLVRAVRFYVTLLLLVGTQVIISALGSSALLFAISVPLGAIVLNYRPVLAFVAEQQPDPEAEQVTADNVKEADRSW